MTGPLDRLRRLAGQAAAPIRNADDALNDARDWLQSNAPSLYHAAGTAYDMAVQPVASLPSKAVDLTRSAFDSDYRRQQDEADRQARIARYGTTSPALALGKGVLAAQRDFASIGQNAIGEPLAYGVNRKIGNAPDGSGPFSGQELNRLAESGTGGRYGAAAIRSATDPTMYLPVAPLKGTGLAAKVGNVALGGIGPRASSIAVAAGLGAGQEAGKDVIAPGLERLGLPSGVADLVGGLAGAGIGGMAGGVGAAGVGAASRYRPKTATGQSLLATLGSETRGAAGETGAVSARTAAQMGIGAGVGASYEGIAAYADGDNPEEIARRMAIGGAAGAAALLVGGRLAHNETLRHAVNDLIHPLANAPDAKAAIHAWDRYNRDRAVLTPMVANTTDELAKVITTGATIKPEVEKRLMAMAEYEDLFNNDLARVLTSGKPLPADFKDRVLTSDTWSRFYDDELARLAPKGAPVTPAIEEQVLRKTAQAKLAAAPVMGIQDEMRRWLGRLDRIVEMPDDYTLTPAAQAALEGTAKTGGVGGMIQDLAMQGKLKDLGVVGLNKDIYAQEKGSGQLDAMLNRKNQQAARALELKARAEASIQREMEALLGRTSASGNVVPGALDQARAQREYAKWEQLASEASAQASGGATGLAGSSGLSTGTQQQLARMTHAQERAIKTATNALADSGAWLAQQVDRIATRVEQVSMKALDAGDAGEVKATLGAARANRSRTGTIDAFIEKLDTFGVDATAPARARMLKALEKIDTRQLKELDPVLNEFDRIATRLDRITETAMDAAIAPTPKRAVAMANELRTRLAEAGMAANEAVQREREAVAGRMYTNRAAAFRDVANIAQRRMKQVEAAGIAKQETLQRQAARKIATLSDVASRYDKIAQRKWQEINQPDSTYYRRLWEPDSTPAAAERGGMRLVGAERSSQKERIYATGDDAILDGTMIRRHADGTPFTSGEVMAERINQGLGAVAERQLINQLTKDLGRLDGAVLPDLPEYQRQFVERFGEKALEGYRKIEDVKLNLAGSNKDDQRVLLQELLAHTPLPPGLTEAQRRSVTALINRGKVPFKLREDIAAAYENALAHHTPQKGWPKLIMDFFSGVREVALSSDAAMVGRTLGPNNALLRAVNPLGVVENTVALAQPFYTSLRQMTHDEFMVQPEIMRAARAGVNFPRAGVPNPILEQDVNHTVVQQLLSSIGMKKAGDLLTSLERWQFERFVPEQMANVFTITGDALQRTGKWSAQDADAAAARFVNNINGAFASRQAGLSGRHAAIERLFLLSPAWTRGTLATIPSVFKGGADGYLARRFWASTALHGIAWTAGLTTALAVAHGDVRSPADVADLLGRLFDPRSPDAIINPDDNGSFMKVSDPFTGQKISLFPVARPVMQMLLTPMWLGMEQGVEDYQAAQEHGVSRAIAAGITGGLVATLGGGGSEAPLGSVRDYLWSRKSIPLQMGEAMVKNEDGRGLRIVQHEGRRGLVDRVGYLAMQELPGILHGLLNTEKTAAPTGLSLDKRTPEKFLGNFIGLNVTGGSSDPQAHKDAMATYLKSQGIYVGDDPIGDFRQAQQNKQLDPEQVATFRATHPDVVAYLDQQRREVFEQRDLPFGKEAARAYWQQKSDAISARDQQLKALGEQGLTGNAWRQEKDQIWNGYFATLDNAATHLRLGDNARAAEDMIDQRYRGDAKLGAPKTEGERFARMLEEYMSIRPLDDSDRTQRDAAFAQRAAYINALDPTMRAKFDQYRLSHAKATGGDEYVRYMGAQDVMSEYMAIPRYVGATAPEGRVISSMVSRARQYSQFFPGGGGRNIAYIGLFGDPEFRAADGRTKALAIAAVGGALPQNPLRQLYWQQHAGELARFYSDISREQVQEIAQWRR